MLFLNGVSAGRKSFLANVPFWKSPYLIDGRIEDHLYRPGGCVTLCLPVFFVSGLHMLITY